MYMTTCDTGGRTSIRSIPPVRTYWKYFFLPYIGRKPYQYTSELPTANTTNAWGSIVLFILEMYHCVRTKDPYKRRTIKPRTNEQTLGFLVKTRMAYKRRIRVTKLKSKTKTSQRSRWNTSTDAPSSCDRGGAEP